INFFSEDCQPFLPEMFQNVFMDEFRKTLVNRLEKNLAKCVINTGNTTAIQVITEAGIVMVIIIFSFPEVEKDVTLRGTKFNIEAFFAYICILTDVLKL